MAGFARHFPNAYARFLRRVETHGFDTEKCWGWRGATKGNGYGHVSFAGVQTTAHRMAYELFCGEAPEGMDVCHRCDNRWCVNPDHLFLGTRADNVADMCAKGRAAGGNRKHLKENTIQEIRARLHAGVPPRLIAQDLNVNYGTVTAIKEGRSYGGISQ